MGLSAHLGAWCYHWVPEDPVACQSPSCLGLGLQIWGRARQIGYSPEPWTYFCWWALPGRAVIQTTQTLVESLQNIRAQRGRKRSDSLPLETWQAARQNFEASPANKLHASLRQLTPWLPNPIPILCLPLFFMNEVPSSHLFCNPWSLSGVDSTWPQRIVTPCQIVINESLSIITHISSLHSSLIDFFC